MVLSLLWSFKVSEMTMFIANLSAKLREGEGPGPRVLSLDLSSINNRDVPRKKVVAFARNQNGHSFFYRQKFKF